jgi:hypothetical protein
MRRRGKETILAAFRTSPLKFPTRSPAITETESPENINHLHGNWRFGNSGIYLQINKDRGVVRNRLTNRSKTKKAFLESITFLLIRRKENIKNAASIITISCGIG